MVASVIFNKIDRRVLHMHNRDYKVGEEISMRGNFYSDDKNQTSGGSCMFKVNDDGTISPLHESAVVLGLSVGDKKED